MLLFKNEAGRRRDAGHYLLTIKIKDYNLKIISQTFFDQPVNNNMITYKNIQKTATFQRDHCRTLNLLDYPYFREI